MTTPVTDTEFAALQARFAERARACCTLPERERALCELAALIAQDESDAFAARLEESLNGALTPDEASELVVFSAAFWGLARAKRFFAAQSEVFAARGLHPAPPANETADRAEAGLRVLLSLFGEGMADPAETGPEDTRALGRLMRDEFFGEFYARPALSLADRELAAFCFLIALGSPAQMSAHIIASYNAGLDRAKLIAAVAAALPHVGWPRAIDALTALNATDAQLNNDGYDDDPF